MKKMIILFFVVIQLQAMDGKLVTCETCNLLKMDKFTEEDRKLNQAINDEHVVTRYIKPTTSQTTNPPTVSISVQIILKEHEESGYSKIEQVYNKLCDHFASQYGREPRNTTFSFRHSGQWGARHSLSNCDFEFIQPNKRRMQLSKCIIQ